MNLPSFVDNIHNSRECMFSMRVLRTDVDRSIMSESTRLIESAEGFCCSLVTCNKLLI